jgi:hypothetical protein
MKINFECGDTTCSVEPGDFCQFVGTLDVGTSPYCWLFNRPLGETDGWLQRCTDCLNETKEDEE